jgi:putative oxidoreductase
MKEQRTSERNLTYPRAYHMARRRVMMFPNLARFSGLALLLLRLMLALIFGDSGWRDLTNPAARSHDFGMSEGFTIFLGVAEFAGALGVAFGVLTQLAAMGLILINLGAIQKKIFVWHTGFWGQSSPGWYYDLTLIIISLVIITTNGGPYVLKK